MKEVELDEVIILNPGICLLCGGVVPPFSFGSLIAHPNLENNYYELCEKCDPEPEEE
jgi:hypothetical protein